MANQSQPRPWLRLGSLAPRPQMQPPSALLPRPTMLRPAFRPPIVTQPGQDVAPPLQPPRPRAPPPLLPSSTPSVPPPLPSPVSPPKSHPKIATSPVSPKSPVIQNSRNASPVIQNPPSKNASPVIQNSPRNAAHVIQNSPRNAAPVIQQSSPKSPVTQKYPYVQRASPTSSTFSSQSPLPASTKPRNQFSPPSIPSSPAMKQDVPKPMQVSPAKVSSPSPPSTPPSPYPNQMVSSPRTAKHFPETPPQSPKINAFHNSPPLFSLPPSQLKSNGVYERNIDAVSERKIERNPYDDNSTKPKAQVIKTVSESEDIGMRVITISGENRGAVMELGYPPRTHRNPHKLRTAGELSEGNLSWNEGRSEGKNPNPRAKASMPMHTFMNSNVQGINSSIVFNSSLSHHDPGVHLSLSRNPVKGRLKERFNGHNVVQKEEG